MLKISEYKFCSNCQLISFTKLYHLNKSLKLVVQLTLAIYNDNLFVAILCHGIDYFIKEITITSLFQLLLHF